MEMIKKDIVGNIPKVGDIIIYNPAYYKGVQLLLIEKFSRAGCPVGFYLDENLKKTIFDNNVRTGFYITNLEYGK